MITMKRKKATEFQKKIELLKLDYARWTGRKSSHYIQTQKLNKKEAKYLWAVRTSDNSSIADSLSVIGIGID